METGERGWAEKGEVEEKEDRSLKDANTQTCQWNGKNKAVSNHPSGRTLSTLAAWELGDLEHVS